MDNKWAVALQNGGQVVVEVTHTNEPNHRRYINMIAKDLPGSNSTLVILGKAEAESLLRALQEACGLL